MNTRQQNLEHLAMRYKLLFRDAKRCGFSIDDIRAAAEAFEFIQKEKEKA